MLDSRSDELEASLVRAGAPVMEARREVSATIERTISYAGWTDKYQSLFSSLNPVGGPHFDFTIPEPIGVVAVVAPAAPALLGLAGAVLPVIASGNTCVVLASEEDPRTALIFAESLATSDMPGGVVNILTGKVKEVLPHLAKHMEVQAIDLHGVDAKLRRRQARARDRGARSRHGEALSIARPRRGGVVRSRRVHEPAVDRALRRAQDDLAPVRGLTTGA